MDAYDGRISAKLRSETSIPGYGIIAGCQEDKIINPIQYVGMSSWRIVCVTTAEAYASLLHPSSSCLQLSGVPTCHCDMLQLLLVAGQRPRTLQ
jgi:hypothetical protein